MTSPSSALRSRTLASRVVAQWVLCCSLLLVALMAGHAWPGSGQGKTIERNNFAERVQREALARGVSPQDADRLRKALQNVDRLNSEEIRKALLELQRTSPESQLGIFLSDYDWTKSLRIIAEGGAPSPARPSGMDLPPSRPGNRLLHLSGVRLVPPRKAEVVPLGAAVQQRERALSENDLLAVAQSEAEIRWGQEYRNGLIDVIRTLDPKEAARLEADNIALSANPYLELSPPAREMVRASVSSRLLKLKTLRVDHPEFELQVADTERELSLLVAAHDRPQISFAPSQQVEDLAVVAAARVSLEEHRDSRLAALRAFQLAKLRIDGDETFEPVVRRDTKTGEREAAREAARASKAMLPRQTMAKMTREHAASLSRRQIWALAAEALGSETRGVVARSREAQLLKLKNLVSRFLPDVGIESVEGFGLKFATNDELRACKAHVAAVLEEQQRRQLTSVSSLGQSSLIPMRISQLRDRLRAIDAELDRPARTPGEPLLGRLFDKLYAADGRLEVSRRELQECLFQGPAEALRDREGRRAHFALLSLYQIDGTISPAETRKLEQDRFEGLADEAQDLLSLLPRLAAAGKLSNQTEVASAKVQAAQQAASEAIAALDAALGDVAPYHPERSGRLRRELREALPEVRGPPHQPGPVGTGPTKQRRAKPYGDQLVSTCSELLLSLPVVSVPTSLKPGRGSGPRPQQGPERSPHSNARPSSSPTAQPP